MKPIKSITSSQHIMIVQIGLLSFFPSLAPLGRAGNMFFFWVNLD